MTTYRVVLEGTTLPGFDPAVARTRLASLVKKDEDVAGQLLSGKPCTIKSSVDHATGLRYVDALTNIGVACRVEAEVLEIELESSAVPTAPRAPEKGVDEKFCAECGAAIKAKAEICPKCGVRQPTITQQTTSAPTQDAVYRGLYRSSDEAMVAGVCAGLAHKWNSSRTGLRIVTFIACWFMVPFLAYVGCWLVLPARPTKVRTAMVGPHDQYSVVVPPDKSRKTGKWLIAGLILLVLLVMYVPALRR